MRVARRPPRGVVVVSERYLKNDTILTMMHASKTTKPWCTSAASAERCASRFWFSSASSCSRCHCSVKMGGICDAYRGCGWASREELGGEMGKVGGRGCCSDEGIGGP